MSSPRHSLAKAGLSRRSKGMLLALGLAVIAAVYGLKIRGLLQRGETVFWLAELWAPAGMLSLGLVTCLEYFVPAKAPAPLAKKKAPGRAKKA